MSDEKKRDLPAAERRVTLRGVNVERIAAYRAYGALPHGDDLPTTIRARRKIHRSIMQGFSDRDLLLGVPVAKAQEDFEIELTISEATSYLEALTRWCRGKTLEEQTSIASILDQLDAKVSPRDEA